MQLHELSGLRSVLYPSNHCSTQLKKLESFLPFSICTVLDDRRIHSEEIAELLKNLEADSLLILENSPRTRLAPPLAAAYRDYQSLLQAATQAHLKMVSPFFTQALHLADASRINSISIATIQQKPLEAAGRRTKAAPRIMLATTGQAEELYEVQYCLQEALQRYSYTSRHYSYHKLGLLFPGIQYLPALRYSAKQIDDECIDFVFTDTPGPFHPAQARCKPHAILLVVQAEDSAERIEEKLHELSEYCSRIIGLLSERQTDPWLAVYYAGKFGLPVCELQAHTWPQRLVSILLGTFGKGTKWPGLKTLT